MNVENRVRMTCQPCHTSIRKYEFTYTQWMKGEVPYYMSRQRERVRFTYCGTELAVCSMAAHRHIQDGRGQDPQWAYVPPPPAAQWTYRLSFPSTAGSLTFPFEGCRGDETSRTNLQIHLIRQYLLDTIVILKEVHYPC